MDSTDLFDHAKDSTLIETITWEETKALGEHILAEILRGEVFKVGGVWTISDRLGECVGTYQCLANSEIKKRGDK